VSAAGQTKPMRKWAAVVVEDDPLIRVIAVEMLDDLGVRAYEAGDGAQALEIVAECPDVRLVFSDVRMPGLSGADLARELAQRHPDVHVALTSGYPDKVSAAGMSYIQKPWGRRDLAALVDIVDGLTGPARLAG